MIDSLLQKMAQQQGNGITEEELNLMQTARQPTNTQMMLQQMVNPQPQAQPQMLPQDMMMAANEPDRYGGVSMQTRKAMHDMGAADPTGDMGDLMIGRAANSPANSAGYAAKTGTRGKASAAQTEQLVKMLMGRGMTRQEAQSRAAQF
jgi:hypothetical protein